MKLIYKLLIVLIFININLFAAGSAKSVPSDLLWLTVTLIYFMKLAGLAFFLFGMFDFIDAINKNEVNSSNMTKVFFKFFGSFIFMNFKKIGEYFGLGEGSFSP